MAYRVEITRRAESDLEELYLWVVDRAPQQGARWFNGLERAVLSSNHESGNASCLASLMRATMRSHPRCFVDRDGQQARRDT